MKKKINIVSVVVIAILFLIYGVCFLYGVQPVFKAQKIAFLFILFVIAINIGMYVYDFVKKNKVVNTIISLQLEIAIIIAFVVIIKNINANLYNIQKGGNNYIMKINVNDNSKEYYLYRNSLFVTSKYAIKEYLSDTELSYEEDTPVKIEYNKEIFSDELNKRVIAVKKKIMSSQKINGKRIVRYITNYNDYEIFCSDYEVEKNYTESYFDTSELICISYSLLNETIPLVALDEENNYIVYMQYSEEESTISSFCFIEISEKNDAISIELKDYDEELKNESID